MEIKKKAIWSLMCCKNGRTCPLSNFYILDGHIMLRVVFDQFIFKNNTISSFSKYII